MIIKEKVYKFSCETDELKEKWIDAISKEIKKLKIVNERKFENIYQVKLKKKIITDMLSLPNISSDVNEITKKIEECINIENCFLKKERVVKKKLDLAPNKAIVEQKSEFKDEKVRMQMNPSDGSSTVTVGTLNVSLLRNQTTKKHGFFSFCNKICMCFKKKKTYDEIEDSTTTTQK